jgi:hypothetical protein
MKQRRPIGKDMHFTEDHASSLPEEKIKKALIPPKKNPPPPLPKREEQ